MPEHVCPNCATTFSARREQRFCSVACANQAKTTPLADERACPSCGTSFRPTFRWRTQQVFCSKRCVLKAATSTERHREGLRRAQRKRAAQVRGTGKKSPYVKRDGRHEHRVTVEQTIGRKLSSEEIVHHRDHNPRNNDPKNLELTNRAEHSRYHSSAYWAERRSRGEG